MKTRMWEFWIDVGGTFTDCIARSADRELRTLKVLSSGATKGRVEDVVETNGIVDSSRQGDPEGFWIGYEANFLDEHGEVRFTASVTSFDGRTGALVFDRVIPPQVTGHGTSAIFARDSRGQAHFSATTSSTNDANSRRKMSQTPTAERLSPRVRRGTNYELVSGEEAPILAIRRVLGLKLTDPIPPCSIRLGTTRGTNALLTRSGACTGFLTTKGFADVLLIGTQARPRLFDLAICKPKPLFQRVVEIDERIDADGRVLKAPDEAVVRRQLEALKAGGIASIAICLLHAYANAVHERLVERIAREIGFAEISTSSRLSPLIKIVSRGDTTVMNAYLNPLLRKYVADIQAALMAGNKSRSVASVQESDCANESVSGQSTLRIMTSAGGLVDADRFVGKDSILSGPAGGVIGYSRVAQRAGFPRSIGFDMGGTSTDVSRFDGTYEREFETEKAGVRVVAPMLAIETVAAGGGSICGFDGVKLFVGPQSAGADPGPACYGRGGPLTVTDVNLFLGRIPASHFPFSLDHRAVESRLAELCVRISGSPLGKEYTPIELAQGFCDIANANMVRAIRKISVAKGYDPADYVLVTFGGAGGQHACAIAQQLGAPRILIHPYAGLLSAYGMGLADVRRFGEHAVLKTYSNDQLQKLEPLFREMETSVRNEVVAEGIPLDRISAPIRSLDMRYKGVESTIHVMRPDDGDYQKRYEELHTQLYGYTHAGRPTEIVAARVEVVGTLDDPPEQVSAAVPRQPVPDEMTQTWFADQWHTTGVYLRDSLHAGDEIAGPAILCEPTSTIVVEPGFAAQVLERGEIVLERAECRESRVRGQELSGESSESSVQGPELKAQSNSDDRYNDSADSVLALCPSTLDPRPSTFDSVDPVLLEIFNNLFASIAEQMGVTLQKTSFSTNVKERWDFSCAVFDSAGDLVVNAPHIPVHLGAMSETVKRILADNRDLSPGDVFVTNDPYRGGSHLPDVTVVTPVHDHETKTLLFFTASRAHHAEIGGVVPGSMPPFSKNLAEEGVLIRNFKLVDRGKSREAELRALLLSPPYPTRSVQDNLADVSAQVAANNRGVQQLQELVERYTLPVVRAYMEHIQRAAAEKMRFSLAAIPNGRYEFTDHLDCGAPIHVTITIRDEAATVDFTGTGPPIIPETVSVHRSGSGSFFGRCLRGLWQTWSPKNVPDPLNPEKNKPTQQGGWNLNANRAIVTAAVLYVFRCLINEDIPLNGGVLEPVEIILPECLLNPPEHDDPARCAAVVGGNVETSQRIVDVLFGALQVAAASQGTMNNLTFGDDTFGYYETICGGSGATADADGADAVHTHMTNTRLTDVEVIERRYPVRIRAFSIRRGSGGRGALRGGDGVVRSIEFLRPLKVSILSERRQSYLPFGLRGGEPGQPGRNRLRRAGQESEELLGGKVELDVGPGDVLTLETPGGGGYDSPT